MHDFTNKFHLVAINCHHNYYYWCGNTSLNLREANLISDINNYDSNKPYLSGYLKPS